MIKQDITYQDKLNELRLDLSHPISSDTNFVLVEGESDIKVFRKLFDLEKCKVEYIPGGKAKLEECVSELIQIHTLLIGIRDADFIHLDAEEYNKPNMFLTDFHDMEMTMLSEIEVLKSLILEYTDLVSEEECILFKNNVVNTIDTLSFLKYLNSKDDLRLKFKGLSFHYLISVVGFSFDFELYFTRLLANSENARVTDFNEIIEMIDELRNENPDLMQLSNGHDLLKVFAKVFQDKYQSNVNDKHLASSIRMIYSFEMFNKTNLYQNVNNWALSNSTELFS